MGRHDCQAGTLKNDMTEFHASTTPVSSIFPPCYCGMLQTRHPWNSACQGRALLQHMSRPRRHAHVRQQPRHLQGDSTQLHVKSLDVVLGAEMAVLIVDDTAGVWPQHSRNLLQVTTLWRNMRPCLVSDRCGQTWLHSGGVMSGEGS